MANINILKQIIAQAIGEQYTLVAIGNYLQVYVPKATRYLFQAELKNDYLCCWVEGLIEEFLLADPDLLQHIQTFKNLALTHATREALGVFSVQEIELWDS